jgi:hypothetical protein
MHKARERKDGDPGEAAPRRSAAGIAVGDTFSEWTTLEASATTRGRILCRCKCGTERLVAVSSLVYGASKSCGAGRGRMGAAGRVYMKAGEVYERLTVLEDVAYSTDRANCRCACGTLKDVKAINLRTAQVRSCGCLRRELRTVHGMSDDPVYKAWYAMIERTTNPRNASWLHYGGRGITVCERWQGSPEGLYNFVADVGPKPPGTSLDRIDNDGNYEPGNVQWATPRQQGDNRRKVSDLTAKIQELQAQVLRLESRRQRPTVPAEAQDALF